MAAPFPLETVVVNYTVAHGHNFFGLPIFRRAKKVIVRNLPGHQYFIHHRVADSLVVRFEDSDIGPMSYYRMVERWIEEGRELGTEHSWEVSEEDALELFQKLRTDFGKFTVGVFSNEMYKSIAIPMDPGKFIHVSCTQNMNTHEWILKMSAMK